MKRVSATAMLVLLTAIACLAFVLQAGASVKCTGYPSGVDGTGNCASLSWYQTSPMPFPTDTSAPMPTPSNAYSSQAAQRNSMAFYGDPNVDTQAWFCYSGYVSSDIQAFCGIYNPKTAAVIDNPAQLNSKSVDANLHEAPGGTFLRNNYALVLSAGFATTATSNACLQAGGGIGTLYTCQWANLGNTIGGGTANADITASGSLHALATTLFSEPVCTTWGHQSNSTSKLQEWVFCFGQSQSGTLFGVDGNSMIGTVLYPVFNSSNTITNLEEDTGSPIPGATTSALYDVLTDSVSTANNGTIEPIAAGHSDAVLMLSLSASTAGTGNPVLSFTLPAVGSYAGGTCTWSGTTSTVVSTTITNLVNDFASDSNMSSGCSGANSVYTVASTANTSLCTTGAGNDCAYFTLNKGNPAALATVSATFPPPTPPVTGSWTVLNTEQTGLAAY